MKETRYEIQQTFWICILMDASCEQRRNPKWFLSLNFSLFALCLASIHETTPFNSNVIKFQWKPTNKQICINFYGTSSNSDMFWFLNCTFSTTFTLFQLNHFFGWSILFFIWILSMINPRKIAIDSSYKIYSVRVYVRWNQFPKKNDQKPKRTVNFILIAWKLIYIE